MPQPLTPEAITALRLLADGTPRPFDEILRTLALTIAPGKAKRRYQLAANYRLEKFGPRATPELSESKQIESGQKAIAREILRSVCVHSVDKYTADGGEVMLRLRPGVTPPGPSAFRPQPPREETPDVTEPQEESLPICDDCGALVADAAQHEKFHAERALPPPDPTMAFFSAVEVAAIVRHEVEQALRREVNGIVRREFNRALDNFQRGMQLYLDEQFDLLTYTRPKGSTGGNVPHRRRMRA